MLVEFGGAGGLGGVRVGGLADLLFGVRAGRLQVVVVAGAQAVEVGLQRGDLAFGVLALLLDGGGEAGLLLVELPLQGRDLLDGGGMLRLELGAGRWRSRRGRSRAESLDRL